MLVLEDASPLLVTNIVKFPIKTIYFRERAKREGEGGRYKKYMYTCIRKSKTRKGLRPVYEKTRVRQRRGRIRAIGIE
jgi:hypothetical protein